MLPVPKRPLRTLLVLLALWAAFYASVTLFAPALLDDADSVHAEVAREMLLRRDYVTLYANGIRYLEKAPLLYWSMAASMRLAQLFGAHTPRAMAAACRFPISLTVLFLAWFAEALARRMFRSVRAGLYAVLITLSGFGIFLFSRITLPDVDVCLWLTLALYAFWTAEEDPAGAATPRSAAVLFGLACALNILSKGLIGLVFPLAIVGLYLLATRGIRGAASRLRQLHPLLALAVFLVVAAPWHILAGLANPTQGHPAPFTHIGGHWQVPLPTDGNVRGWFWFYFVNEHLLRYLNLRVPRDYDTVPLWLFWGLCFVWLMPWSAFLFHAFGGPLRRMASAALHALRTPPRLRNAHRVEGVREPLRRREIFLAGLSQQQIFLVLWASVPLLFFSLSTRQEYYVLPALPAFTILIAAWLARESEMPWPPQTPAAHTLRRSALRINAAVLALGTLFVTVSIWFLLHTKSPAPHTDLAALLAQNPGDYALSMGHFLDLNAQALGLFRLPLALAAISLFAGPLAAYLLRRKARPHAANLALAAAAFGFLVAAHLGLQTFAPVLSSAQLAETIAPLATPADLIVIHGEYESGSTLGFYLQRADIHILEGRSSNLWYGSFFPDAPPIFETPASLAAKWPGPQRIFLWQSTSLPDAPKPLPLPGPVYVIASGGGKQILSNRQ